MIRRLSLILCMGSSLLAPARAATFNYFDLPNPLRWGLPEPHDLHTNVFNPVTRAIRFQVASDLYSTTNAAAELNAIKASFGQWETIPGTYLKFEFGGLVDPAIGVNTEDNTNVIYWTKAGKTVNGGFDNIGGSTGITYISFFDDNTIAEADIILNGTFYKWFTDITNSNSPSQFIESTVTHEVGHFLGLEHSPIGGASMFWQGNTGVDLQAGLSADDINAARALYGKPDWMPGWGSIRGQVTLNQTGILGALVVAEDANGNVAAGSLTRANGIYELPGLPPGNYIIRVTPLDAPAIGESLVKARDISFFYASNQIETGFLPSPDLPVTVTARATNTQNIAVAPGKPPFNITFMREPSRRQTPFTILALGVSLAPGQSNVFAGVLSSNLPNSDATLSITGSGVTVGNPIFTVDSTGHNAIFATFGVASDAPPGLRSLIVQQGTNRTIAAGFFEIPPTVRDDNFDGIDDLWQRAYFPLFTAPEAAPSSDPDGDGFTNLREYQKGSVPTNSLSIYFNIESVEVTLQGSVVTCETGPGKQYQLYARDDLAASPWQPVGAPVKATGESTQFSDPTATNNFRFYRVEALP